MARNSDIRSMHGDGNEAMDMVCESRNFLAFPSRDYSVNLCG